MMVPPTETGQTPVETEPQLSYGVHCDNCGLDLPGPMTERNARQEAREHLIANFDCYKAGSVRELMIKLSNTSS